ncbi:MAG TPA: translocation/assembly module TamB domain-containing protein [Candidatus Binatia bacterium]|nr:translocation/assembly module TamB domain-containing protein [Candidatus Binatia bacterium]
MAIRDLGLPPHEPQKPYLVPPRQPARWKRVLAWIVGILVALILLIVIGIDVLLHSARFHNYVLRTAESQASQSLNTRVQLQNFALHLSRLGLDLYGLTVYGVGPGANRPLLQVDHIALGVRIVSVLHRQWNLDDVAVDHPVVNLLVDAAGHSNLPTMQSSGKSNTNVFDLAVRRILLDRGAVYYNDRKTPLYADLHDLRFQSSYDATDNGRYFGTLSYRDGHLQYGNYGAMSHDLDAQFDARRSGLTLSNVRLTSGQSQVLLNASVNNYASPKVHANYVVILALGELRNVLRNPSLPAGVVLVDGAADYVAVPGRPAIDSASLQGTVRSRVLRVRTPALRTDIHELNATYSLANGNAELRDVSAQLLGGSFRANATIRDIAGSQQGHVVAALRGISLADLKAVANSAGLKQVAISGQLNANTEAAWSGSVSNMMASAEATANANIAPAHAKSSNGSVPLNAEIHARYNGRARQLALDRSYIRTPQTSITLDGTVSNRSALQVRAQANDLHELETVAALFSPPAQPLDLHGSASFSGTVSGSTSAPQLAGQLQARNVQLRGSAFRVVRTAVQASPSLVSLQNGDLELAQQQGRVTFNLQSGLHHWSHLPTSPFTANVSATQVSLAELARAANLSAPLSGTLNANIAAHGTQLSPMGQGAVTLRNANISGEPVQLAEVRFNGNGDAVHSNLLVRISAGTAQGRLTYYPKQEGYDAVLQATNIHLEQLQSLRQRNLQVSGTLNLTASGRGTLKDPQGTASLTIPQLGIQKQQIRDLNFQGNVAHHEATFSLGSQVVNTPLKAQGKVALIGNYYADVSLDTPVIPLQPLVAAWSPAQAALLSGQTEIHAAVRGPLKNKTLLEAHLNIPTLAVNYRAATTAGAQQANLQIAAVTPIRADYIDGVLSLQPGEIKGTDTDVRFQGRLPLSGNATSTLSVQGAIDLAIAQVFDPTLASSGQIQFDINAAGHLASDNVEGQVRIVNAAFSTPDAPLGLSAANGVLILRRDRLDISQFTGKVGGGTVTASGGVAYRPSIQFNLGLKGSGLRLLYPESVRTDLGLSLAMTGNTDSALLTGQVNINRISFTPDFDLSTFMTQFSGVASPPATQSFADNVKLNVVVRSSSELNVVSPTVSIRGDANLRVIGTAADPVIVGRANLTGGDVIVLGNRYVVQGGTIAFVNTVQTEPVVNLQVNTTIQQYNIAMHFRGPVERLQTNYTSDPALPQADIIHLIAFGNTEEAANAAPAQSTTMGAESLVASQVSSQVTSRLQKALGVSQISLDPQLGATTGNQQQGARLTVRQRVSGKLFVTFSTDVTTTQYSAIQLQYQMNRKWSVSGVRDQNGGFGLDGRYHKDF